MMMMPRASPRAAAGGALSPSSTNNNNNNNHNNHTHNPLHHTTASAAASTSLQQGMMELEVAWNPVLVCAELHQATQILSDRGLKLAAKWTVEQWMGLPSDVLEQHHPHPPSRGGGGDSSSTNHHHKDDDLLVQLSRTLEQHDTLWKEQSPMVHYAKTLLDLGDYAHAAATLSQPSLSKAPVESMSPPLPNLSPYALYLRAYALYMAGERRKEEDHLEQTSDPLHPHHNKETSSDTKNPYLLQLTHELLDVWQDNRLDAFGLYVLGMVLVAATTRPGIPLPPNAPTPQTVLMQSLLQFPYNWSAWLDLAACALQDRTVEREIEDCLQPTLAGHYMYHFFCAHLQAEHQAHHEALSIYERWMDPALFGSGSPYLLSQYGVAQYHLRQFALAKRTLEELHHHMPYRLECMDVYSNILYVQEDSVTLSQLAHAAIQVDKFRAETCCIVGNYYSVKQQRAKAIQYFQRALNMDRTFTSAWTLMGHEYVEWKQSANAIECYRKAVQSSPGDYRAWYGLGQTYEFLNMPLYALYYYKRAVQLRPYDARMWCALGTVFAQLQSLPDAIRAYERAVQQGDTEGVATQKLASLYKQDDPEKAAQCYLRHLELRYQVTHPNAVATQSPATLSLDLLLQGLVVESAEAEAILYLAHYHKSNDEYPTAVIFCSRLLEYPGPEKEEAKALLRDLRSRVSYNPKRSTRTLGSSAAGDPGSGSWLG